ncbi:Avo2p KNAG_0M02510 [Huiozyma naganishii CBS 8797]|uniref:Uncharacterized protein n=1 Tax=Huiozyma naganishii (strain ATCC MYA-139 / BCRC 22969 / CBS 8797 / KCTC 17520 / NBRC 10181 / NCYC 3082 / Yp74L-3) TaxID=1071383 RepID=J7SAW3_HUIN7|nr:hypothetical protein KNAG_0M02510 [Kazachstania naganishii CBS 8797]CCK73104.1 hypothetical protein KNAG_0M02510 [Kazachstania naganishii CBS 8797]
MLGDPSVRLRKAIVNGNLLIVKRLLRRFPELVTNVDPRNGWSSLHYASFYGRYLICVYLVQLGHDHHELIRTFKGNTCVHLALMNGHEQTTHLLLQHFPRFIDAKGENGSAPIHVACMHDYFRCASLLISVGADLSLQDGQGETPLHICLEYGSTECLKLLLQERPKVDVNAVNFLEWKPVQVAETFEFARVYNKLLKESTAKAGSAGSNFKKPSFAFRTPLMDGKPSFEDGPSPLLTVNSPYSANPITIPGSAGAGAGNTVPASPISKLLSISTSRKPSISMVQSIPPFSNIHQSAESIRSVSGEDSPITIPQASITSGTPPKTVKGKQELNKTFSNDTMLNNKYILQNLKDENKESAVKNSSADDQDVRHASPTGNAARKRVSLLNIPISRVRNSDSVGDNGDNNNPTA